MHRAGKRRGEWWRWHTVRGEWYQVCLAAGVRVRADVERVYVAGEFLTDLFPHQFSRLGRNLGRHLFPLRDRFTPGLHAVVDLLCGVVEEHPRDLLFCDTKAR